MPVWGIAMAARAHALSFPRFIWLVSLAIPGAFIIRGSACTINDIFDRDIDAAVGKETLNPLFAIPRFDLGFTERTKTRPLACGSISVQAASVYFVFQMAIGAVFFGYFRSSLVYVSKTTSFFLVYSVI